MPTATDTTETPPDVRSNGVLLYRVRIGDSTPEFLVIRRHRGYELPKGRIEETDTSHEAGALRELKEETGFTSNDLTAESLHPLHTLRYNMRNKGRMLRKEVQFYIARCPEEGLYRFDDSIKEKATVELRFVSLEEALAIDNMKGGVQDVIRSGADFVAQLSN